MIHNFYSVRINRDLISEGSESGKLFVKKRKNWWLTFQLIMSEKIFVLFCFNTKRNSQRKSGSESFVRSEEKMYKFITWRGLWLCCSWGRWRVTSSCCSQRLTPWSKSGLSPSRASSTGWWDAKHTTHTRRAALSLSRFFFCGEMVSFLNGKLVSLHSIQNEKYKKSSGSLFLKYKLCYKTLKFLSFPYFRFLTVEASTLLFEFI